MGATSWQQKAMVEIMKMPGVRSVVADQCRFGLETWDDKGGRALARKCTRFMSNAEEVLEGLQGLCKGGHIHQHLVQGRAGPAAIYPPGLCRASCRGLVRQLELNRGQLRSLLKVMAVDTVGAKRPEEEEDDHDWRQAWDDVSGKEFDYQGVKKARELEMEYVKGKEVWENGRGLRCSRRDTKLSRRGGLT